MARPQKQTVDYFPHDAHAVSGDTLTALQGQFGNNGYAFWFKLLEKLASTEGHFIDCRNSQKWQVILGKALVDDDTGRKIMVLLVEMEALDKELWEEHQIIWCQNLVDNLAIVYQNRRRELPQKPSTNNQLHPKLEPAIKSKIPTSNNPISTSQKAITTPRNTQSKVKKSRVNNKENYKRKYGEFQNVLLTEEEHKKLVGRLGKKITQDLIERLSTYMKSKGKRYKDHYATILNWSRRDDGRTGKTKGKRLPDRGSYTQGPDYPDD